MGPGPVIACRESPEVGIGERQHHQIGRALAQILRRVGLLQPMAFAEDDVH